MTKTNTKNKIAPVKIPEGFDINAIRKDFPILDSLQPNGKKLVYLDSAATTHKPKQVIKRVYDFMLNENATVRRGMYSMAAASTKAYDEIRVQAQSFLNAKSSNEIIFVRGTTEGINLVTSSFSEVFISKGDMILISAIEHHSNIVPWQLVCERKGAKLQIIPVLDNGELDQVAFEKILNEHGKKIKIMALTHVSNSLGTVNPIKEMIAKAHAKDILVLIDGAQAVQHYKVDVQDLDADFYVFSGHKLYAPTGIGVLYGKEELLNKMPPYHGGGEMIKKVTFEKTTYAEAPNKFEAGTPAIAEAIGLGEALSYIENIGIDKIQAYEKELLRYATEKAKQTNGLKIIGEAKDKAGVISMVFDNAEAFDVGMLINEHGIAIRTGHHCAQPVMDRFEVTATARLSLAFYNTQEDIDKFFIALEEVLKIFE